MSFFSWGSSKKNVNQLQQVAGEYLKLDYSRFLTVYSSDLATKKIPTYIPSILLYTNLLKEFQYALANDILIKNTLIPNEINLIYLREFFLVNNCYIDPESAVRSFSLIASSFLESFNEKEQQLEKDFNTNKNLLLTQGLVNNIIQIYEGFKNATNRQKR